MLPWGKKELTNPVEELYFKAKTELLYEISDYSVYYIERNKEVLNYGVVYSHLNYGNQLYII